MNIREKFKTRQAKKKLKYSLAAIGLSAVAVLTVAVSSAFMTARTDVKNNEFKGYTVTDTQIVEPDGTGSFTPEGSTYEESHDVVPGDPQTSWSRTIKGKDVRVQNPGSTGKKAVYVRVLPVFTGATGKSGATTYEELTTALTGTIGDDWFYNEKDGYFYFRYALKPGYMTTQLFKNGDIPFKGVENSSGKDMEIHLTFITDTVQAQANGSDALTTDSIKTAWGSVPDGIVTDETATNNRYTGDNAIPKIPD